jgi:predicted RNA-binding protein YlqC (UPF0109 family)
LTTDDPRPAPAGRGGPPLGELVRLIARTLVDQPEEVRVHESSNDRVARIELTVAKSDIGKIIGRDGKTAQSIRALLQAAAAKANRRALLDIVD